MPLVTGDEARAVVLRRVLDRGGFSEKSICARLGLPTLDAVDLPLFKSFRHRFTEGGLSEALVAVFLFGEAVDEARLSSEMDADERAAFAEADLLRPWTGGAGQGFSPVRLVPIDAGPPHASDLLLAGDRADHPDGSRFVPFSDIVFSGHNPLTRQFLRLLPRTPCGEVLDLCSGTGVGALAQAPAARRCTAVDVAERSVHFAGFNAWLNGSTQVDNRAGDLYTPLQGRRFDRIIAHPPYVPA